MSEEPAVAIRRAQAQDTVPVLKILEDTHFFYPQEIEVAREVLETAVKDGPEGDYQSYVTAEGDKIIGWICFGPTPCTLGTFDIYWVAVEPARQGRGVGKTLVAHALGIIKNRSGRMVAVDTSGIDRYAPTRRFYESLGFTQAATVDDFYAPGNDQVIYIKRL